VVEEAEYPDRTTDHGQATGNLYHLLLWVVKGREKWRRDSKIFLLTERPVWLSELGSWITKQLIQALVVEEAEYPDRTTDHGQATGNLYHLLLWVESTLLCNLQSRARTHAVLVIGLYELLCNPTT
jgi:hypothetical protein